MAVQKNQHYVPQMQLRYFSTDIEKKLINIYHLKSNKLIENIPIRDQASEDYFYGNDGVLEKKLEELEEKTGFIYKNIAENKILPRRNTEEHNLLLLFILFSKVRTRKQLDDLNESQNLVFQKLLSYNDELKHIAPDYEIQMNNPFGMMLSAAFNSYHLASDLEYKLLVNNTEKPFILSDHPVIMFNDFNNQKGTTYTNGRGLACKGFQIIFPINPKLTIFFYDSWAYKVGTKKSTSLLIDDENVIEQFNLLQILNSNEVLFFSQGVSREYITELLKKSEKYDSFDQKHLEEVPSINSVKNGKSLIMVKKSTPKLKICIDGYKFQDRAKGWKPDSRIVYYRTEWHAQEHQRTRRLKN